VTFRGIFPHAGQVQRKQAARFLAGKIVGQDVEHEFSPFDGRSHRRKAKISPAAAEKPWGVQMNFDRQEHD
jgi:hypothetical protein